MRLKSGNTRQHSRTHVSVQSQMTSYSGNNVCKKDVRTLCGKCDPAVVHSELLR